MAAIQALPDDVIHLMAAGEVIDSLAAVVRELAENALDAGATHIRIALWPQQWRVRVADDGVGMSNADLQAAATPHSTSKIHQREDLWQIHSLGFRGEALHSLVQLSELEIASRTAEADEGWSMRYTAGGGVAHAEVVAIAPGTIVTVSNLFGNLLPRRHSLPSLAQQLRAVQLTVYRLALCHPQVTWQVQQGDRDWFCIWGGASAQHIFPQLLREVQPQDLQVRSHRFDGNAASVEVLLGLPDRCHRRRPDWVNVGVNGRIVHHPELEQTIVSAFRRTLPRDRYPVCLVQLRVPPGAVDWNRHPAKAEIYLQSLDEWRDRITHVIHQTLSLQANTLADSAYSQRVEQVIKAAEMEGVYDSSRTIPSPDSPLPTPHSPLKAIAQLHNTYILAEHPSGIWLVEQHIAHERVLYEQLRDRWQMVPLNPPILLSQLSPTQVEQLQRLGIEIEDFGETVWAARTVPEPLSQRDDCAEALVELSLGGDLETALVATACRTAIRNGMPLTLLEMQTLLGQWQATQQPRTCPHGRPICLMLEESSLSRYFRRHWVIGKSHGI
ncbi:DNA mismatch repair endonuclease MutL [Leptolyngbya sp. AN02str]|uniref:DNA mismatch repair endonuclease MutL n=1 Tax=Leptolyngbya sp. AN02str TaxID=3423363 RepID=UPI003D312751